MHRILLPVDDSASARHAVQHARVCAGETCDLEIHLVNVQPVGDDWRVGRLLKDTEVAALAQSYGEAELAEARAILDAAHVPYFTHILRGEVAEEIVALCARLGCDQILMGANGRTSLGQVLMGSTATQVLHLARVPVTFVK
jgi:nucleotide-binding universal stress UspA family protein